jgi:hypothetical protein
MPNEEGIPVSRMDAAVFNLNKKGGLHMVANLPESS